MTLPEVIDAALTWIVAPVLAVVWMIYRTQQEQTTDIAVLEAKMLATKEAHDREIKEVRASFKAVLEKLDHIEAHLRVK
jgi:tRNA A-37 threonylcarbamoyl transferase component Bud32